MSSSQEESESDNSSNDTDGVRRSKRKRVSTIMKIQGHSVLAKNNYVLKGGSYEMGAFVADSNDSKKKKTNSKQTTNNAETSKSEKVTRKQSPSEVTRLQHNEAVKASILTKQPLRRDFLVKNKEILMPFMDDRTRNMVEEWSHKKAAISPYRKEELFVQPDLIENGEMRDYQLAGLNFMVDMHRQNLGMILGDEMGLGKTLQTIAFLCYLKEQNNKCGPSLVVVPLSVLYSWRDECRKWAPSLRVMLLHASGSDEQIMQKKELGEHGADNYDVIVTTYDMVKVTQLLHTLTRLHFRYCILDEGHKIKSGATQIAQVVRKLHCENRLLLTGTPLQNNLSELVSLLNFLHPDIFTNFATFADAFDITNNRIDKEKMLQSQKVLDLFMLRRLKDQVEKLMPKKIETKVYCPLSKQQVFYYKSILLKDINALAGADNGQTEVTGPTHAQRLVSMFMQLRKACLHPFLFDGAEADTSLTTLEELMGASGKLAVLDSLLRKLFLKGNRCVLFSQFTSLLDILADYCTMRGWNFLTFDGRTPKAKRNYYVQSFNAPDSPYFLFLMSTRSGSMGLNLQSADTCILFDSDQNPQMDLQAQARVHRIGQTKTVHVYRLVSSGTVEERMVQRAEKKLVLDRMVNRARAGGAQNDSSGEADVSASEMFKDIKFGCAAVFGDSSLNTLPTDKEIDYITDRKRTEIDSEGKLKGNVFHDAETYDLNQELSETQVFVGVDFKKLREQHKSKSGQDQLPTSLRGIPRLWNEISQLDKKRQSKSRIIMVDGKKSGYGNALVPVLASNNYELENGESSVFDRELSSNAKVSFEVKKWKRKKLSFVNQDRCQVCGNGGLLHLCGRCPMSAHKECCEKIKGGSCSHHRCILCDRSPTAAGGLLYPCQSCPEAFCEDCLPKDTEGFRILGSCDRLEDLGYNTTENTVYIHCSAHCEAYAKQEFGWKEEPKKAERQLCPPDIDVSMYFGSNDNALAQGALLEVRVAGDTPVAVSTSGSGSSTESSSDEADEPANTLTSAVSTLASAVSTVSANLLGSKASN